MRISYLELRNYRRFRDLKLQFPDGIVGILGLNGSGKTTLIESVAWALFGNVDEVVRTSREGVRWAGAKASDKCSVTLEFELAGSEYKVVREMGGKNLTMKAELRTKDVVLAEGDRPVKEKVEQLLGMDHKSFFTSVFARQKELNALQGISAAERKKTVLRMLRIDAVDTVIENVRRAKRDVTQKIEGANRTLLDEDGREREKVLSEQIPALSTRHDDAEVKLRTAEEAERRALAETEAVRARRDSLRKDDEAYNSLVSDIRAKEKAIEELRKREERLVVRMAELQTRLRRLPELEKASKEWEQLLKRREELETERTKHDRACALATDIEAASKEETKRLDALNRIAGEREDPTAVVAEIDRLEKEKTDCESKKAELSGRIGELNARMAERSEASRKDARKLKEIEAAGKDGVCPTCERTLEDSYELLVGKLRESSEQATRTAKEAKTTASDLRQQLQGLANRAEGISKKRKRLDERLATLTRLETSAKSAEDELRLTREKLAKKKAELAALGEIRFTDEEYSRLKKDLDGLKPARDEYVRVKESEEHVRNLTNDIDETRAQIERGRRDGESLKELLAKLEPKKRQYDVTIKELDQKTVSLNQSKDDARKRMAERDKARAELETSSKELETIVRIKRDIESDRKRVEELALLEDVVLGFKDNLIARVAPTLAELTSRNLDSVTDGKYSHVDLDDSYEMHIDDQGTAYPVSRFSGGEADLANLSLRLAISEIIAERTGATPVNLLILDEIFGSQDPNRKRSVMTALAKLSTQFRQIFLITHIEDIKDAMNYIIKVEELEDGTSHASLIA